MKVEIVSGEFKGKTGTVVGEWGGHQEKLAGGETPTNAVTVQVEDQLQPIVFDANELIVIAES